MKNNKLKKIINTTIREFMNESVINRLLYHGSNVSNLTTLKPQTNKYYSIPPSIFLSSKKSVAKDYGQFIYMTERKTHSSRSVGGM